MTDKKASNGSARPESEGAAPAKPQASGVVTTHVRWPKKSYFRSSRSAYEQLLQSIYDGVLITKLDGRIVDNNARAAQLLDSDSEKLLNTSVLTLISGADEKLLSAIGKNLEDQRYTLIEARCIRSNGQDFPAEIAVNRIELDSRGLLCFFIRDITVRKRAQEALEAAVARLEEHDTSRLQFVSNVSHELRTPLTSMIYAVNNMLSGVVGAVPPRVRQYLQILDGDCRRLLATVNDILDMRKIETKTLTLTRRKTPLARLVERGVASLRLQAQQKALDLRILSGRKHWFVDCDAQKMERVLLNVVGNSIKFTPQGGEIEISVDDDAGHPGHARISVRDTGIGIPPEALDKVTMRYFTVGDQPSGSGLGLAISKEIVALHGGVLDIKSPPPGHEKGTLVTVRLPLATPPRVLLVDDEGTILDLLDGQISAEGYQVLRAPGGKEALDLVARFRPDVIVLDLSLQDMDGEELILKLKSEKAHQAISVVVVTGIAISSVKTEILSSFGVPVLKKPWNETELLERIAGAFFGSSLTAKPVGVVQDHAPA